MIPRNEEEKEVMQTGTKWLIGILAVLLILIVVLAIVY